jgi:hypothetical protein
MGYKSPVNLFLDENFKQAVTLPMELQIVILRSASLFLWISIQNSNSSRKFSFSNIKHGPNAVGSPFRGWFCKFHRRCPLSLSALFVVKIDRSIVT